MLGQSVKNSPSQKTKIVNEIINLISKVTDPIKQEIYIKDCSLLLNISEAVLFNSLAQIKHLNHQINNLKKSLLLLKNQKN